MALLDSVFKQLYRPLCLYALHYLHDTGEAEDVVQDCFVRMIERGLPDRQREIFLMSKRDSMTYREIAEELSISEKTVEHQISKALKTLRGKREDLLYFLFTFVA